MRLRVVTWNVHSCVGTDRRHDPGRVADVLAVLEADVIGLQEVDWRRPPVEGRTQLDLLAERLRMESVAGPNLRDHDGEYGNGLLTRFAIGEVRRVHLAHEGREPRGAIDADIDTPWGRLRALVTHLGLSRAERRAQLEQLRAVLDGGGPRAPRPPTVLLGDLNEWRARRRVPSALVPDPFPAEATGRTYPSRLPWFRLDRVLALPEPARLASRVVRTPIAARASDHLPLVVDLCWSTDGRTGAGPERAGRDGPRRPG